MTASRERLVCAVVLLNSLLMWAVADRYVALRDSSREAALVERSNQHIETLQSERATWPQAPSKR
jgi:hypothetical protein